MQELLLVLTAPLLLLLLLFCNWPVKRKQQDVKGYATFYCSSCRQSWSSYNSWITVDVQDLAIINKFEQKCKDCDKPTQPYFAKDEIQRMKEYVVSKKPCSDTWRPPKGDLQAPHDSYRCQKCNYGAGPLCSSARRASTTSDCY